MTDATEDRTTWANHGIPDAYFYATEARMRRLVALLKAAGVECIYDGHGSDLIGFCNSPDARPREAWRLRLLP